MANSRFEVETYRLGLQAGIISAISTVFEASSGNDEFSYYFTLLLAPTFAMVLLRGAMNARRCSFVNVLNRALVLLFILKLREYRLCPA